MSTNPGVPSLAALTPHFAITVLECDRPGAGAFGALRRFLRATLADPGRAHAVRLRGERLLTAPGTEIEGLGTLADLGIGSLYVLVRERWQSPRWSRHVTDLTHELTVALSRHHLVALHSTVSSALLRRWVRDPETPYRFVPEPVLAETFPDGGGLVASPAWSRLTSPARLDFPTFVAETTDALDHLAKTLERAA
ncbi:hypothetical protein BLA60_16260 [Actinophytocola xinjiangensis]|uniref:Uncharacterized protein n=1 Tax=Actinophytocola xinjiangensis TaxID=485602 RepID=A0A7Z0WL48_9PSEU|nr:hypothetical protein [Actinophytocola xinjiangensis]OLF10018.1 hypothetical protein BLA60_16260 [Actinophytocola xinjiangensis]